MGSLLFGALSTELFRSRQVGLFFRPHVRTILDLLLSAGRTDELPLSSIEPIGCLRGSLATTHHVLLLLGRHFRCFCIGLRGIVVSVRHVFAFRPRIPTHGVAFFESYFMIAIGPR
jgi:hypothetical protein